jgi:hypothetical protein
MIFTKMLACRVPSDLATRIRLRSRGLPCEQGETRYEGPFLESLETIDPVDPRLGTRIGLAQRWDSPASVASFEFSGRAGARLRQAYGAAGTRPTKSESIPPSS